MVSEQLANPYGRAEVSSEDRACAGAESERCSDPEAAAIGRLIGIYAMLSDRRAVAEMLFANPASRELRLRWERLSWCLEHYQPALGPSSYRDVLRCYQPSAAKGLEQPDPLHRVGGSRFLFDALWVRTTCPERSSYPRE
jgi:hypothetical protein